MEKYELLLKTNTGYELELGIIKCQRIPVKGKMIEIAEDYIKTKKINYPKYIVKDVIHKVINKGKMLETITKVTALKI